MRTTTAALAAASVLAVAGGLVAAAGPATAAPAPAPLLYTTYKETADGGNVRTVNAVRYDGSGGRRLASTALVITPNPGGGSSINGPEVVGPAASYSADHARVAWTEANWTPMTVSYSVKVLTVATKAVATFPLPSGYSEGQGGAYVAWSADGARLAIELTKNSLSTVATLDLGTGNYSLIHTLGSGDQVDSIAVSPDGTIGYTSDAGVAVLPGGVLPGRYLHRVGTDEYCREIRVRPGTQREFAYSCAEYGATKRQVLRSQTPNGTARTLFSADTSTSPSTFLDDFAWAPSGTSLALVTTTVRTVDEDTCTNAMTTSLATVKSNGTGLTTLRTQPTITDRTCRGNDWGDTDDVVWSSDGKTIVFLHAPKFLGPQSAFAVNPAAPQRATVLARGVIDLSS